MDLNYLETNNMFVSYWREAEKSPSKQETLNQCWVDAGPSSTTLGQHQLSIDSTSLVSTALVAGRK